MFTKDIGIDLGTANTLVYLRGKGIIIREPSVVAVNTRTDKTRYVGMEAKEVIGRTPGSIVAVRPLKDGVIADFDIATTMLQEFIKKALRGTILTKANVIICIPSGVTAVERRAVREACKKAGANNVLIIEEPMAAAIGAGLPTRTPSGSMIVDIGGGTTEVAVIALGGIVASRSLRCAGDEFDSSIINYIKKKYNLLIGERTAENIKVEAVSTADLAIAVFLLRIGENVSCGVGVFASGKDKSRKLKAVAFKVGVVSDVILPNGIFGETSGLPVISVVDA